MSNVRDDGTIEYPALPASEQEHVPGIDPATGKPDSRFDGTITAAAPITLVARGLHPQPPPPDHPAARGALVTATRPTDLLVAQDLDQGLSLLAEDERLRAQAAELRRSLDPRRPR